MDSSGKAVGAEKVPIDREGTNPSTSADGSLVYLKSNNGSDQMISVDRAGHVVEELSGGTSAASAVTVSPDGARVAVQSVSAIWIYGISSKTWRRLVNDIKAVGSPRWTPDSQQIGFVAGTAVNGGSIYVQPADSSSAPKLLRAEPALDWDWSRDRDTIVFSTQQRGNQRDIYVASLSSGTVTGVAATTAFERRPEIDPTGRFVAYESDESGRFEIYVRTFPGGSGRWVVSDGGGRIPRWSSRGDELFYLKDETLMSAKVLAKDTFRVEGQPRGLFTNDAGRHFKMPLYAPVPGGQRFIIPRPAGDQSRSSMLLENWLDKK